MHDSPQLSIFHPFLTEWTLDLIFAHIVKSKLPLSTDLISHKLTFKCAFLADQGAFTLGPALKKSAFED